MSISRSFRAAREGQEIRLQKFMERDHLVVPVVALVEGVIHASNSSDPELVLSEEFQKNVRGWNGRPVMLNHPKDKDDSISANDPKVLEQYQIGTIFNARVEDKKLKMDAYLDIEKMEKMGNEAVKMLASIREGKMNEVSVGTFVVAEPKKGKLGDKNYDAIWTEIVSDHLAFLPEGIEGACSIEMGCGTRAAGGAGSGNFGHGGRPGEVGGSGGEGGGGESRGKPKSGLVSEGNQPQLSPKQVIEVTKMQKEYIKATKDVSKYGPGRNEDSKKVSNALTKMADIHKQLPDYGLFVDDNDGIFRYDDETQERAIRAFSSATSSGCGGRISRVASTGGRQMNKQDRIKAIIASGKTCFKDSDLEVLEALSDERIDELEAHIEEDPEKKPELDPKIKAIVDAAEVEAKKTSEQKREEFLKANPDINDVVVEHKAATAKKRTDLIDSLKTAQKVYSEAELAALPTEQLQKLVVLTTPASKPNFEGRVPRAAEGNPEAIPAPPSMRDRIIESRKSS